MLLCDETNGEHNLEKHKHKQNTRKKTENKNEIENQITTCNHILTIVVTWLFEEEEEDATEERNNAWPNEIIVLKMWRLCQKTELLVTCMCFNGTLF